MAGPEIEQDIGPPLIGALLRMPVDFIRAAMRQALHARGYDDITEAHFQVLRWPGPRGQRPVELAAEAGMSKQAMNYLLGQLEQLGYVTRAIDPDDVRSRRVYATERGTSTISAIRHAITEVERDWEARLGAEDWHELKRILNRLHELIAEDADARFATQPRAGSPR